jgi:hypothetical protein
MQSQYTVQGSLGFIYKYSIHPLSWQSWPFVISTEPLMSDELEVIISEQEGVICGSLM